MTKTINNENKKLNFSNEREQSQACLNSAEHEKNQGQKVLNVPNKREQNQTCLDSAEREGLRPKGNVPNLRFPEFHGEWEKCKLGDIAPLQRGFDLPTGQINNGKFPVVYSNGIMNYHSSYKCVAPGLITGRSGTIGKFTYIEGGYYWPHNTSLWVTDFYDNNPKFIYYLYQTIRIEQYSTGSGVPTLNRNNVHRHQTFIPKLEEQNKIAIFLSLLDERIATQNKIIEDLKKLKCAIIEKLYEEVKGTKYFYRQLFNIINERNKQLEYSNVLSASQEKGMVSREDLNLDIQFERSNINTYKIVRNGDYVIHLRSFQGGFAFSEKTGICSPAYTVLRPNNLLVYGYLSNYFTSRDFVKSLIIVTYGIRDGRSINVDEWLKMKVVIPPKEQQTHIANVIESIENKIKNEETYSNFLLNQKQYLLHQMFI